MRSRGRSFGITHSLTPLLNPAESTNYVTPEPMKRQSPLPRQAPPYNPHSHSHRSRKHRLLEEKNT